MPESIDNFEWKKLGRNVFLRTEAMLTLCDGELNPGAANCFILMLKGLGAEHNSPDVFELVAATLVPDGVWGPTAKRAMILLEEQTIEVSIR